MFKRPLGQHLPALPPLTKHPLAGKLAIVTVIKLLGLMALWWAFFSGNGVARHGEDMTPDQAAAAILHPNFGNTTKQ